ncbi:MAG: CocE/NonD family hydrolase [Solirubrobacteraceae bacterium]
MTLLSQILARRMRLVRAHTHDVVCRPDLPVAMDDGAILLADRWVAAAAETHPQPTVLVRSPYGRKQLVGMLFGRLLAERGLPTIVQSVRGTFGSGGRFSPFDERDDGLATLRWIRSQPWHDGPVGTIGPSYLGFVQWAVAANGRQPAANRTHRPETQPPDAMSIQVSASQFYDQTYTGGSLSLETLASWMVILVAQERRLAPLAIGRALRGLHGVLDELPLGDPDQRATGKEVAWFQQAFGDTDRAGAYWASRDFSAGVPEVRTPVSFVGGWYDILLPWMLADFEAMQAAGRSVQLLIGPWSHTSPALMGAGEREGVAWLRAHLLGDTRLVRDSPVRLLVTGERSGGGWRDLPGWPPPGTGERRLYLDSGRRLADEPDAGAPAPAGDRYRYDPAEPTPSLGGPGLMERAAVLDNTPLEARDDVLTYSTAPLRVTREALGHVSAELWARASLPYFDLFARVCDVDPDGVSRNVCDGLIGVAPGRFEQAPDGAWHVVWRLWPIGHRFAAGHRIRLQVSSGAHPRYARNPGTGENIQQAGAGTMTAVEIEILRDAEHPSALVLPMTT